METELFGRQFEALLGRYIRTILYCIQSDIRKARDKQFVRSSSKTWIEEVLINYQEGEFGELCELFAVRYKEGKDIYGALMEVKKKILVKYADRQPEQNPKTEQPKVKNKRQASFNILLTKAMLRYVAFLMVYEEYDEMTSEPVLAIPPKTSKPVLHWTNIIPTKENKNEFVQLIYGLHQAGYINHGRGEITKIVEAAAEAFDIKLGVNWQSNHSSSIHKAKRDYEPSVFRRMQEAYRQYADDLIEGKRKRK
jgi:hypothetical protein